MQTLEEQNGSRSVDEFVGIRYLIILLLESLFMVLLPVDLWPRLNKASFLHCGLFLKHFVVKSVMGSSIAKC